MTPVRHLPCSTRVSLGFQSTRKSTLHTSCPAAWPAWLWPGLVQLGGGTADGASSLIHLSILSHTHTHQLRVLARVACCQSSDVSCARDFTGARHKRATPPFPQLARPRAHPPKEVSSLVVRLAVLLPARTDAPAANPCSWLPNARTSTSARPLVSSSQFLAIAALMSRPEKFPAPPRHHWNDTAVASSQAFPPPRAHYSGTVESTTEADSASRNLLQRHTLAPDASIYRHLQSSCLEHHSVAI